MQGKDLSVETSDPALAENYLISVLGRVADSYPSELTGEVEMIIGVQVTNDCLTDSIQTFETVDPISYEIGVTD